MSEIKETLIFLSKEYSFEELGSLLDVPSERIKYLDLLSKERKNRRLVPVLKKVSSTESNTLEKAFLEIMLHKKHYSSSFLERLFLSKKYGLCFKEYLSYFRRYKCKDDVLLNVFFLNKKVEGKDEKKIVSILRKKENVTEILFFFRNIISEECYYKFIKKSKIESWGDLFSKVKGEVYYDLLVRKIYKSKVSDAILLINNISSLDNILLYKHLIKIFYEKKGSFFVFKEYFNIIWIDDANKLNILFSWLRIFIQNKEFNEFNILYKYLEGIKKREMVVYNAFYACIKEYKKNNKLTFKKFKNISYKFKDENPFSCIKLKELAADFEFNE